MMTIGVWLHWKKKARIYRLFMAGASIEQLAEEYHCCHDQIEAVIREQRQREKVKP